MKKNKGAGSTTSLALTDAQKYNLWEWLKANKAQVEVMTKLCIADHATKQLGYEVSISSINKGLKFTGIDIKKTSRPEGGAYTPSGLHKLRMRTLIRDYRKLCNDLGRPFDVVLQEWVESYE